MKIASLLSIASAHIILNRPQARTNTTGDMEEDMRRIRVAPCALGGEQPTGVRTNFSSLNNTISVSFMWNGDNNIYLGLGENPTEFPYKIGSLKRALSGRTYDIPIDLRRVPEWTIGTPATIQVICNQPRFDEYQCGDIFLDTPKQ
jgi:hypothetical protein